MLFPLHTELIRAKQKGLAPDYDPDRHFLSAAGLVMSTMRMCRCSTELSPGQKCVSTKPGPAHVSESALQSMIGLLAEVDL